MNSTGNLQEIAKINVWLVITEVSTTKIAKVEQIPAVMVRTYSLIKMKILPRLLFSDYWDSTENIRQYSTIITKFIWGYKKLRIELSTLQTANWIWWLICAKCYSVDYQALIIVAVIRLGNQDCQKSWQIEQLEQLLNPFLEWSSPLMKGWLLP